MRSSRGELVQSAARRLDVGFPVRVALRHQILGADREDDAVHRAALAVLAQQREELPPACAVGRRVGVLRRVAARGVEKHRFVGEPPVAVARAADAAQRALAHPLLQRELQPRVDERRRLAGPRRADEHVPRQVVQAVAAPPLLLERRDGFFEPFAKLHGFGGGPLLLGVRLAEHRADELVARAVGAQPA